MTDTGVIDPALQALSSELEAGLVPFTPETLAEARASRTAVTGALKGRLADRVTITREGDLATFRPEGARRGHVLYIHGGGWVLCDNRTHGAVMTDLAATSGLTVIGPDYPLAPEHPAPAALDMLVPHAARLAADGPLYLSGDSAGANLALGLAARLRDEAQVPVAGMTLFYGCYRNTLATESHRIFGDGSYGLSTEAMRLFWSLYLSGAPDAPYADLTGLDFTGLPPAFIGDVALDVLRDEGTWLAGGLAAAGIDHVRQIVPGATHGFLHHTARYDPAFGLILAAGGWLKARQSKEEIAPS